MDQRSKCKTIKLLEENIGRTLYDIGLGNDFLDLTRKTKITKAKINKCYYTKLKIYSAKKTISKMKRQPPE